jgi:hypothetical protein
MLLGFNTSGVELNVPARSRRFRPGRRSANLHTVHTYESRYWGGFKTIQSDVWLTGCNNSAGELRLQSGPTCRTASFVEPGTATCIAKVVVRVVYPFGRNLIAGPKTTATFAIDPSGNNSAP